ncbi:hypothetical protein ACJX0J_042276, partial [Zea mays]
MTSIFASNGPQPFTSSTHQRLTFGQHFFLGYYSGEHNEIDHAIASEIENNKSTSPCPVTAPQSDKTSEGADVGMQQHITPNVTTNDNYKLLPQLNHDEDVLFEDDDEEDGYLFAGQDGESIEDIEIDGTQDAFTVTPDVPDPYDKVYSNIPEETHSLDIVADCVHCKAKKFQYEPPGFYCRNGQIDLAPFETPPQLRRLWECSDADARHFRDNIRFFNGHFSFTSLYCCLDSMTTNMNCGIYTFRAHGMMYHNVRSFGREAGAEHKHLELYFYDDDPSLEHRYCKCRQDQLEKDKAVIKQLVEILKGNPYSEHLRSMGHVDNIEDYHIALNLDQTLNQNLYNAPITSEVAAVWIERSERRGQFSNSVMLHGKDRSSHGIRSYHGCYDALSYPMFFPKGELGWHANIPKSNVSMDEVDAYREQHRTRDANDDDTGIFNPVLHGKRLFQQFAVDTYIKIESSRLDFIRKNQDRLRADLYKGLVDSLHEGENRADKIGKRTVLSTSFIGGPRDMRHRYMDAMALVRKFGKPDIFLTMTCNPNWDEITRELLPMQSPQDRPDLVVRIFRAKLEELKKRLTKHHILGKIRAYVYVVELQKRGLLHVHFLLIMQRKYKLTCPDQYDLLISAEIPDKKKYPELYKMIIKHMMHAPCGLLNPKCPCTKGCASCKNHYPRAFSNATSQGKDSYPTYRRHDDGRKETVRGCELDNRWVIPYNPYLLWLFNCHINVEACGSIKAVKYLFKYIYKGHDRASMAVTDANKADRDVDEMKQYRDARWVTPPEALWRIFSFDLSQNSPTVMQLQLHLENMHMVSFHERAKVNYVVQHPGADRSMLTAYFEANRLHEEARGILYSDFPEWTVDGDTLPSFREAAQRSGLLEADDKIDECLNEAAIYQMSSALRRLFATILVYCEPNDVAELWQRHLDSMSEDYHRSTQSKTHVQQMVFIDIRNILQSMGKDIKTFPLPTIIDKYDESHGTDREIYKEESIEPTAEDVAMKETLNEEQRSAYDKILSFVDTNNGGVFFVDGPGGTGKTYLYKALLAALHSQDKITVATATSGVAASILPGGGLPIRASRYHLLLMMVFGGTEEANNDGDVRLPDEFPIFSGHLVDLKAAVQTTTLATFTFTFDKTSAIEREERPDQITMDIVVEEGNVDVGNTAEPSYEVVAISGCSAQLSTNDTDEHELAIESEDSKVSVGNAAKQSYDVVGVGIDCIFNHAKVSTKADLGPQSDVIHLTSLDVPNESSQISSDADMVEQNKQDALDTLIIISQHKKPKKLNVARFVSEDYKCTPEDVQLIEYIKTSPGKQVVVNIDSAWLNRNDMECLFHGDIQLSDEALSAYIHCIRGEEHLLHREGGKVFLENTFISSLLKRDGDPKVLLNCKEDTIEKRVDNYLQSDMVFLPMNIENIHWYLAVLNAKKSELKVIKKITTQMQTDGVSCGLWMINYMEYWTGSSLSDNVTQDDITMFRFKLPAILWDSRLNTKKRHQNLDHNVDEDGESSSDVQIIDTPLTSTNTQELMFVLCTYIMGIYNAKYLKKHWIQSTKTYPISLSLQKLKDILDVNKPMDTNCFNMAVRMITCNDALFLLEDKYHYMDLQFCSITKFGRDPRLRAKPDINMLAKLLECWPDMEFDVSDCKQGFIWLSCYQLYARLEWYKVTLHSHLTYRYGGIWLIAPSSFHCSLSPLPPYEPAFDWENERSLIFGQRVPKSIPAISNSGLKITVKVLSLSFQAGLVEDFYFHILPTDMQDAQGSLDRRGVFSLDTHPPSVCLFIQLEKAATEEGGVTPSVYSHKEHVHLAEKEKQKLQVWSRIMPRKESFAWAMIPLFEGNHAGGLSDAAYPSSTLATSLPGSTSQDSIVDPILKLTLDGNVNHYSSGSSVIVEISNLNKVKESYIVDSLQDPKRKVHKPVKGVLRLEVEKLHGGHNDVDNTSEGGSMANDLNDAGDINNGRSNISSFDGIQSFVNSIAIAQKDAHHNGIITNAENGDNRRCTFLLQFEAFDFRMLTRSCSSRERNMMLQKWGHTQIAVGTIMASYHDEVKISQPALLAPQHHLVYTFFHVDLQMKLEAPKPVPHVQQAFKWDCGLACVLMVLRTLGIDCCDGIADLERLCRTTSIWTVDLAYLLNKFSVSFSFCTVTLGANPQYSVESFYREQLQEDIDRVDELFGKALDAGISIQCRSITAYDIAFLLLFGHCIAIALPHTAKCMYNINDRGYELHATQSKDNMAIKTFRGPQTQKIKSSAMFRGKMSTKEVDEQMINVQNKNSSYF